MIVVVFGSCTVDVALTRDEEYVTINSNSRKTSEVNTRHSGNIHKALIVSSSDSYSCRYTF